MKVALEVLFGVASSVVPEGVKLDSEKFLNAVRAWAGRHAKGTTLTTKGHEPTKEHGPRVSGTLSTKVDKHNSRDGRAIHWLGLHVEVVTFGWTAPSVPEEVSEWLQNFVVTPPPPAS